MRYELFADYTYNLYINGTKFLIVDPQRTTIGLSKVPKYFSRINGQWPPGGSEEYNKENLN